MKKMSKSYDARPTGEARRVLGCIELHTNGLSAGDERVTGHGDGITPEILRGRINRTARGGDSELKQERGLKDGEGAVGACEKHSPMVTNSLKGGQGLYLRIGSRSCAPARAKGSEMG